MGSNMNSESPLHPQGHRCTTVLCFILMYTIPGSNSLLSDGIYSTNCGVTDPSRLLMVVPSFSAGQQVVVLDPVPDKPVLLFFFILPYVSPPYSHCQRCIQRSQIRQLQCMSLFSIRYRTSQSFSIEQPHGFFILPYVSRRHIPTANAAFNAPRSASCNAW